MTIKIGDKIKTLDGDQDRDEHDRERSVPPGTVGLVTDVDHRARAHYHVVYPNGVWVILEDTDLHRYEVQPAEEGDTPHDKILLTFPISPDEPGGDEDDAPDGWISIQRDDSPDAPEGETWHPLATDDEAALAVCPNTACLYHCETGAMALLSDEEACKALPEGPVVCIVPRAIARVRYAEVGITIA